jgi:hypothetical protein
MGAFYGSIHVRTDDVSAVRTALESISANSQQRFLIGPAIRGWIGVFPNNSGQDWSVSENLARRVSCPLLHCIVHDDDVFAFRLYQNGAVIGEYDSTPGYFDSKAAREQPPKIVRSDLLLKLLPEPAQFMELQALLSEPDTPGTFEQVRLERFAQLLGLANACTSYEYLQDGERDGIQQWKKFIHVPDLAVEKNAKRAAAAQVRTELKQLTRDGLLLADVEAAKSKHPLFSARPVWCVRAALNEILFAWGEAGMGKLGAGTSLIRWNTSTGERSPFGCEVSSRLTELAVSPSGCWLAVGCGFGNWTTQLWDLTTRELRMEVTLPRAADALCFSSADQFLYTLSDGTLNVTNLARLSTIGSVRIGAGGRALAAHPLGGMLVANDSQGLMIFIEPRKFSVVKTAWIKAKASLQTAALEFVAPQTAEIVLAEMSRHMSGEALASYKSQLATHFLPKESITALKFSPDGTWLFCATNERVHAFTWDALLRAADAAPLCANISAEAESVEGDEIQGGAVSGRQVYGLTFDPERQRILFSGLEGKVRFLELADGRCGDLLIPPERFPILQLELTPDRSALVCTAQRIMLRKHGRARIQVWSYPTLCRKAGLTF